MKVEINKNILNELLQIERFITSLPKSEEFKAYISTQRKKVTIANLQALSLSMEVSFNEKELLKIYTGQEININQHPIKAIRNCISVIKYLDSYKDHGMTFATIQHINKLLCDGYAEFWDEGRLRPPTEQPNLDNDSFRNRPNPFRLEDFNEIKYINASDDLDHPLLKGILFMYLFIYSYPFSRFNLQTALLCFYALTRPTKYSAKGLIPLMDIVYKVLVKQEFTEEKKQEDFTTFTTNILKEYCQIAESISGSIEQRGKIPETILKSLNERQIKALGMLKQKRKLSRRKYALLNNVAIATAFRDLKDMTDKGLIASIGTGRGTYYVFTEIKKEKVELGDDTISVGDATDNIYQEANSAEEIW